MFELEKSTPRKSASSARVREISAPRIELRLKSARSITAPLRTTPSRSSPPYVRHPETSTAASPTPPCPTSREKLARTSLNSSSWARLHRAGRSIAVSGGVARAAGPPGRGPARSAAAATAAARGPGGGRGAGGGGHRPLLPAGPPRMPFTMVV